MSYAHVPVLLTEVLEHLRPRQAGIYIDGTLGGAGYTIALAQATGKSGKVIAIDLDPLAISNAQTKLSENKLDNVVLVNNNFRYLTEIITDQLGAGQQVDGIVVDLGLSSAQLADPNRGFSFQHQAPLDMAFGQLADHRTVEIVNQYPERELDRILREYGEERFARRIAANIVTARKKQRIFTTNELVGIILQSIPKKFHHGAIHPATRTFQALRIATNEELLSLEEFLPAAVAALKPSGRLAVVSFHSLEDRIVKRFFKGCKEVKIINKKVIIPSELEIKNNSRSRSAKLRVVEKI